jgi:hypothetical protein
VATRKAQKAPGQKTGRFFAVFGGRSRAALSCFMRSVPPFGPYADDFVGFEVST